MFLCDFSIAKAIADGKISIEPFEKNYLRPSSVCFTLGISLIVLEWCKKVNIYDRDSYPKIGKKIDLTTSDFFLEPNEFALGTTKEKLALNRSFAAVIFNVSGLARLGLEICPSSLISPGFGSELKSSITLEMCNKGKSAILLKPGMRICHIAFVPLDSESEGNYDRDIGLYSKQDGPRISRFYENWK